MSNNGMAFPPPVDGTAALVITLDWLRLPDRTNEFGDLEPKPIDGSGTPDTLAEHLAAAGLMDWRDAIVTAAGPGQPLHLDPRLQWLMGQAAIEIAVDTNRRSIFPAVQELQFLGEVSDAELVSTICSRVASETDNYPLLEFLRSRLQSAWNSRFNERLRGYVEATATQPLTSRNLWPGHNSMPIGDRWAHRVAATLWPDRYMEMLASFPALFQHAFGMPLSQIDLGLVAALVRASPDVFSSDGVPIGPVVVFVLLDVAESRLAMVSAQDMDSVEIGVSSVLGSVFSRSDGNWIGRAWLQRIIWQDTPRRAGRAQADVTTQSTLRDTLLVQLSSRITPLGEAAFDWVRQEEPLWGVDRVLTEASILEAHGDADGAAEILAGAVRQGLVNATGRPAGLATSSPEATVIGRVLSHLPDVNQWFQTLWHDTYELREQLSYPAHRGLDNPAYPVLVWSLIGLNSSQTTHVDAANLWCAIAAAVFETQRIDPNASIFNGAMPAITRVTVQLGAALVERGTLPVNDLTNFLADQLEPTVEYARLWQIARSEASDATTLDAGHLVGTDLLRQALEAGLTQNLPMWDAALDHSARDDLADFLRRL
ncbi:hypothetical protein [Burkholderia ambifaria]|jgi:hypothetical protein|uniref:hypothetical protein n=1 Tax=Burkholderia TaxID=32008 RepID=UPI00158A7924|nr:hypothetical protein [Burkholderia ambifaria]